MKVAVYSGSFDPMHIGHLAILERLQALGTFDAVYLVVSPQNPLKACGKAANAEARLSAAREALSRHPELVSGPQPFVRVDDIEYSLPRPNYTINTLDALKAREPENDFTLVMGADSLCDIRRWKDWERLLVEYGVVVYPRRGYDTTGLGLEDPSYRIESIEAPLVDVSSTQIRGLEARGEDVSRYLI